MEKDEDINMERYIDFNCNPVLGNGINMADVEGRTFGDALYMYGTSEDGIRIVSTKDMKSFTDYGIVLRGRDIDWAEAAGLWAPDCVSRNGKYYLYYSLPTGECGVSVSEKPEGPFENSRQIKGITGIDPAVLIDDDGKAYIYYGQLDDVSVAELNEDMISIDEASVKHPLNVADFEYHEGISVRKAGGKYYLVYTDTSRHGGIPVCQGYAVSENPVEGYIYKGILVDNFGCDPSSWNNHGCIECFNGKWYMFYHSATNNNRNVRQLFIEELDMNDKGEFSEAEMTSSGIAGVISAKEIIPSSVACLLRGNVRKTYDENNLHKMLLTGISEGDSAIYKYVEFNGENIFKFKVKSRIPGRAEIYIDGKYNGCAEFPEDADFEEYSAVIPEIKGKHPVEIRFFGKCGWLQVYKLEEVSFSEFSFA